MEIFLLIGVNYLPCLVSTSYRKKNDENNENVKPICWNLPDSLASGIAAMMPKILIFRDNKRALF
jgi:hypothetical protein